MGENFTEKLITENLSELVKNYAKRREEILEKFGKVFITF